MRSPTDYSHAGLCGSLPRKRHSAFTLVELLIVVVILGILATVVIPMFSQAGEDAKLAVLRSQLQAVRRTLELYKIDHNDNYPTIDVGGGYPPDLLDGLILATNPDHTYKTGDLNCGPYLQKIPDNPFTQSNEVDLGRVQPDGSNSSAWFYTTGEFRANDSEEHAEE